MAYELQSPSTSAKGTLNRGVGFPSLVDDEKRNPRIPDFNKIKEYRECISAEKIRLLQLEQKEIHDPCIIDITTLLEECNLPFRSPAHFVQIITKDGIYGEIEGSPRTTNLTKEALDKLIEVLDENSFEQFVEKNMLRLSDFKNAKGIIPPVSTETIARLIKQRGLDIIIGQSSSKIAKEARAQLRLKDDYENVAPVKHNQPRSTIAITEVGVDNLIQIVMRKVLSAVDRKN